MVLLVLVQYQFAQFILIAAHGIAAYTVGSLLLSFISCRIAMSIPGSDLDFTRLSPSSFQDLQVTKDQFSALCQWGFFHAAIAHLAFRPDCSSQSWQFQQDCLTLTNSMNELCSPVVMLKRWVKPHYQDPAVQATWAELRLPKSTKMDEVRLFKHSRKSWLTMAHIPGSWYGS